MQNHHVYMFTGYIHYKWAIFNSHFDITKGYYSARNTLETISSHPFSMIRGPKDFQQNSGLHEPIRGDRNWLILRHIPNYNPLASYSIEFNIHTKITKSLQGQTSTGTLVVIDRCWPQN